MLGASPDSLADQEPVVDDPRAMAALRDRRLLTGIVSSAGGKAIGLAAPMLMIPLTFHALGPERYGLWMAVTSLTSMALFTDLGLGNGLLTTLARQHATGDGDGAARSTASAYAMLSVVAGGLLLLLALATPVVPWAELFNVDDPGVAGETPVVVAICLGSFIVNIPLALVQRVQYAQQQVAQSNLWQAAGSVLALGLAGVAVATGAGGPVVIAAGVFAVPLTNLANSLYCFGVRSPELRPHWRGVDRATARVLMRLGARFFLLSVLTSVALNLDNILVARTLGLGAAAHYAVIARLFTALSLLMALVCLPLWPANAEALARGDVAWVRRTTRRMSMVAAGVVAVGGLLLMIFGAPVVALWLHEDGPSAASPALLGGLGLSCVLIAATSPLFSVQNSVGLLRPQLVGWSVYLVVSVMLKLRFVGWWGLAGVPAGSALAFALILMPTAWLGYQRTLAASIRGEAHAGAR